MSIDILLSNMKMLPPEAQSVIQKNAESISATVNEKTKQIVDEYVNDKLTTASADFIGSKNSFDVVTSNISASDLQATLENTAISDLSPQISNEYLTAINSKLINELPTGVLEKMDLSAIQSSIGSVIDEVASSSIVSSLTEKTSEIFSGYIVPAVTSIGEFVSDTFDQFGIDTKYANTIATKALKEAKSFDTFNKENTNLLDKTSKGFVDPTGKFPSKDYSDASDTNKLATGDIRGTPIQDRIQSRMVGAKLPNGDAWSQPETSYNGKYPYNKVTQTESGHIIEIDDTPGAERIHVYHKSGTYIEIDPNGSIISKTVGSEYKIIDKNGYIAIAGKANVSINGSCNIHIGGDCNLEVVGDAFVNSTNDIQVNAAGRLQLTGGEAIDMRAPKIYVEADEEFHMTAAIKANIEAHLLNVKSDTGINVQSGADMNVNSGNNINVQTTNDINVNSGHDINVQTTNETYLKSTGKINIQSDGDLNTKAGGTLKFQSTGNGSFKFGGMMAMDYTTGQFANGQSVDAENSRAAGTAGVAEIADFSKAGLIESRVAVLEHEISDPQTLTLADQHSLLTENEGEDYQSQRDRLIKYGLATPAELDATPVESNSDSGTGASKGDVIQASSDLKSVTSLPDNFKLSPNFTLAMVSSQAAVSKDRVVAQRDLTYGQIVYNLQALALNVLEPIYNVYPNMIVTSGFRDAASSTGTSQHPLGMAVDIQIKGLPKDQYFSVAQKLKEFIQFDQFLLEYCNYTNNPWIHISLNPDRTNRNQILTFWNHKKHSEGLVQLA